MKKLLILVVLLLAAPVFTFAEGLPGLDKAGLEEMLASNRGKVILINFFATWCPPCRAEIPEIVSLRKSFPEDRLLIVGLSVDDNAAAVEPFIEKTGINYPVFMADRSITTDYNVSSVPHNAFIAPNGQLVISEPGMANEKVLDQVIKDLSK